MLSLAPVLGDHGVLRVSLLGAAAHVCIHSPPPVLGDRGVLRVSLLGTATHDYSQSELLMQVFTLGFVHLKFCYRFVQHSYLMPISISLGLLCYGVDAVTVSSCHFSMGGFRFFPSEV